MTPKNPWTTHIYRHWRAHPYQDFKSVLQNASKTYRSKKTNKKRVTFKKKIATWYYYTESEAISPRKKKSVSRKSPSYRKT